MEENSKEEKNTLEIEEKPLETEDKGADKKIEQEFASISRRNFLGFGLAGIAGIGSYYWLRTRPSLVINDIEYPLRYGFQFNEALSQKYFSHSRLAPEYPKSAVEELRQNGNVGLSEDFDASSWQLKVSGTAKSPDAPLTFSLDDIKKLPAQDIAINFKCIEGWARIMNYKGARLTDFIEAAGLFPDIKSLPEYVSLATPNGDYYVGLDVESATHPQTLLVYEMNGAPLKPEHGAPLRLLIPVKYGIKNLKRIGTISFTNERPKDYWAERGYDWYSGL